MATKKQRLCSQCRQAGHTKTTCQKTSKEKKQVPAVKTSSTKKNSSVVVQVKKNIQSPHVVHLKSKADIGDHKADFPVHKEVYISRPKRVAVDLAHMVREANKKRKIQIIEPSFQPSKKTSTTPSLVTKTSKQSFFLSFLRLPSVSFRLKRDVMLPKFTQPQVKQSLDKKSVSKKISQTEGIKRISLNKRWAILTENFFQQISVILSFFTVRRFVGGFIALLLLIGLPFPVKSYYQQVARDSGRVAEESTNGFLALQSSTIAALQSNLGQAKSDLNIALQSFATAKDIVDREHSMLAYVAGMLPVVGKQITSRQHLLTAGQHVALGNTYLVKGIDTVNEETTVAFTDKLTILSTHLRSASVQYRAALEDLAAIDSSALPSEYQQSFDEFKLLYAVFIDDMEDLRGLIDAMTTVFGSDDFRRYLVLFQNHHELRPTGGFMGSFAVVDVQKGKILNIDVPPGGTYDIKGQVDVYLKPPLPLQLSNKRWEFQDANWFPDFAASAQKAAWFYERGRQTTVDGVIAVNATVLERLLRVLGPVENEKYSLLLDADTALTSIQDEVEFGQDKKENKPKAIISELLSQLLTGITDIDTTAMLRLLGELHEALEEKEIQVYMDDISIQEKLRTFGWTGELVGARPGQDYLLAVNANVQGAKTDAKIEQSIDHAVTIDDSGQAIATVTVHRQHTGEAGDPLYGVNNVSYLRLYVPEGATLLSVSGYNYPPEHLFRVPEKWYVDDPELTLLEKNERIDRQSGTRITTEFGKTVFGIWTIVAPGESTDITFTYQLPFQISRVKTDLELLTPAEKWKNIFFDGSMSEASRYSLIVQKQSGTNSAFSTRITYPDTWKPIWRTDDTIQFEFHGAHVQTRLSEDRVFGIVMEKTE